MGKETDSILCQGQPWTEQESSATFVSGQKLQLQSHGRVACGGARSLGCSDRACGWLIRGGGTRSATRRMDKRPGQRTAKRLRQHSFQSCKGQRSRVADGGGWLQSDPLERCPSPPSVVTTCPCSSVATGARARAVAATATATATRPAGIAGEQQLFVQ
jgi:hypothetical protein